MKIRELLDRVTDKRRYGHLMILYFSDLDKEIKDVLKEYSEYHSDRLTHLRNLMKEFGIKEEEYIPTYNYEIVIKSLETIIKDITETKEKIQKLLKEDKKKEVNELIKKFEKDYNAKF